MKKLYLAFTPYHIKASNYIAQELNKDSENLIILSSFTCIEKDQLIKYIKKDSYTEVLYYRLLHTAKNMLLKNRAIKSEVNEFFNKCIEFNADEVFLFTDQPVIYKELVSKLKEKNKDIIITLVEEGLAPYVVSESEKDANDQKKFAFITSTLLGLKKYKYNSHAKSDFLTNIMVREPNLIDTKVNKITINDEMFRGIVEFKSNHIEEIKCDTCSVLLPSGMWYSNEIRMELFESIFKSYYDAKCELIINLHPADEYYDMVKELSSKYSQYIILLEKGKYMSETLLGDSRIKEVISDYSSVLVNAIYLRSDIEAISYGNILKDVYGVDSFATVSLFDYLYNHGKIKDMKNPIH
ncbi:MAG: polysialyltransferase family glycosyltransferase [Clostridium sp.]